MQCGDASSCFAKTNTEEYILFKISSVKAFYSQVMSHYEIQVLSLPRKR